MNRSGFCRAACGAAVAVLVLASAGFAQFTSRPGGNDPQPDLDTLRRMAAALGAKPGGEGLDPDALKSVLDFISKHPDLIDPKAIDPKGLDPKAVDPETLKQLKGFVDKNPKLVEQLKEQYAKDPEAVKKQFGQANPKMSKQQIEQLSKMFKPDGGGVADPGGGPRFPDPKVKPPPTPVQPNDPRVGPMPDQPDPRPDDPPRPFPPRPDDPPPIGTDPFKPPANDPPELPKTDSPPRIDLRESGGNNPFQKPEEKAKKSEEFSGLVKAWEDNVGPLDDTPALKQSLIDMFSNGGSLDGMKGPDGEPWWKGGDMSGGPTGGGPGGSSPGGGAWNWLKGLGGAGGSGGGSNWWDGMKPNPNGSNGSNNWKPTGGSNWSPPKGGGGGSGGGGGGFGGDVSGLGLPAMIVLGIVVAAVIAFLAYRYWPNLTGKDKAPKPLPGLGEWPVDPRQVTDRASLVKAFEYVSVLVCGDGARVWNHLTIAEALKAALPACGPFAGPLARLYALARYTPASEDITAADIAEARRYLCLLAEVPAA